MDLIAKDAAIPITIAGGPGHDDLTVATPPGDVTVDGGAGDDTITVQSATALGGPGDDTISLFLDANPLLTASPTINCGPGSDRLAIFATLQPTVRPIVDAATCPPYLRSVGRFARWPFIAPPMFRVPANRKIQFALFRIAEPASGELRFGGCAKPTSFHAAAGEQVRVKLTIAVRVARTIARYRGRDFICPITVTGTDAQGERIDQGLLSFSLAR
jgi:Ca2+-binding RTX toxin-like protein